MTKIFTLAVIDREGDISGVRNGVLVPSKELILDETISSCHDMELDGPVAVVENVLDLPKSWGYAPYKVKEKVFQKSICTMTPSNSVKTYNAIFVWERTA